MPSLVNFAVFSPILSQVPIQDNSVMHFYGEWGLNLNSDNRRNIVNQEKILSDTEFEIASREINEIINITSEFLTELNPNTTVRYWSFQLTNVIEQIYSVCHEQVKCFELALLNNHIPLAVKIKPIDFHEQIPSYKLAFAKNYKLHAYATSAIIEFYGNLTNQKYTLSDYSLDECALDSGLAGQKVENTTPNKHSLKQVLRSFLQTIRNLFFNLQIEISNPFARFILRHSKIIFLGTNYLDKKTFCKLAFASKFWPIRFQSSSFSRSYVTYLQNFDTTSIGKTRENLYTFLQSKLIDKCSDTSSTTIYLLKLLLPRIFLEDFNYARKFVNQFLTDSQNIFIYSSNLVGASTLTTLFIQEARRKCGSKLLLTTHGGCFSQMKYSFDEMSWLEYSDYYATWNKYFYLKYREKANANVSLLPSFRFYTYNVKSQPSLSLDFSYRSTNPTPKVLYLPTGYYPIRYQFNSSYPYTMSSEWESMQCKFLGLLHLYKMKLICRDYHLSQSRMNKFFTYKNLYDTIHCLNISIDINGLFAEALSNVNLCIHTVFMTTFAEALHQNIPSILLVDRGSSELLPEMKHIEQMMIDVGILHFDSCEAAKFINYIIDDIDKWWFSHEVENAKKVLKSEIYYCDNYLERTWSGFFNDIKQ